MKLENENKVPISCGYQYKDKEMKEMMVEYHVDTCEHFAKQMNRETEYGGKLSVWFPANNKPLIIFSHDKCIFKQYLIMKKSWIGPNGENMLVPKDEGQGIMLSALQSHKFSFGLESNPEELAKVNNERKGQIYKDGKATIKKQGSTEQEDLCESPFVREFEYGASY